MDEGGMMLPQAYAAREIAIPGLEAVRGSSVWAEEYVEFFNVEAEKDIGSFRPDLMAYVGNGILFIEIAVTHFVDEEKRSALKSGGIPTLEIDLSLFHHEEWTWEGLREAVVHSTDWKSWIVNMNDAALRSQAFEDAIRRLNELPLFAALTGRDERLGIFMVFGTPIQLDLRSDLMGSKCLAEGLQRYSKYAYKRLWSFMQRYGGFYDGDGIFIFSAQRKESLIECLGGANAAKAYS